jgi:cobalt-zinc-cadmium efflux system membrane fusion protein
MLVDPKHEGGHGGPSPAPDGTPAAAPATHEPEPSARPLVVLIIVLALAVGGWRLLVGPFGHAEPARELAVKTAVLLRSGEQITVPASSPVRSQLTIAPVGIKDVRRNLTLPAVVEADPARLIKVLPPLSGRVMLLKVALGERVTAGQPLIVLESPDLAQAYADYDRAKVQLTLTLQARDRQRGLAKIGGAAEKDLQQAETDYAGAVAELRRTEARLKQIGVDADTKSQARDVTVLAPMAGSIIDLEVAPGEYWNDPTQPLMTIADLNTVWVTASVPETDTTLVAKGQPVEVVLPAYPGEVFKGNVLFVSDVVDTDTRRTKVRIAFANPGMRLRPGMFANVTFFAPAQQVAIVPTSALVLKDDLTQVYVETAPWKFEARTVDLGFQQGDEVALKSGVKPGERVVVKGGVLLGD